MIQIVENKLQTGVKKFVCDTKNELSAMSVATTVMGSTCYVIEDNTTYILNGQRKWVKKNTSQTSPSSSGGTWDGGEVSPGSSDDEGYDIIYDGGEVI